MCGFSYTLFPLLLLLDAAVACRRSQGGNNQQPYRVSDKVAEGVVSCLEELLKKCHIGSVDQMVVIMKKLTSGAILTPSEAAEEFREGIIKCFRAMISGMLPCSGDDSCSCKRTLGWPQLSDRREYQTQVSEYDLGTRECLLAFLQSQSGLAAVGHWLFILLKVADAEASRGQRGSAHLRVEAFVTLRILVAKVTIILCIIHCFSSFLGENYLLKRRDMPLPPSPEFQEISMVLPSQREDSPGRFLYVEYGGRSYGFELELISVEVIFKKMQSLVSVDQM